MIRKPTAAQIRAYRDKHNCSLQQAKRVMLRHWRTETLEVLQIQYMVGRPDIALKNLIAYMTELENME